MVYLRHHIVVMALQNVLLHIPNISLMSHSLLYMIDLQICTFQRWTYLKPPCQPVYIVIKCIHCVQTFGDLHYCIYITLAGWEFHRNGTTDIRQDRNEMKKAMELPGNRSILVNDIHEDLCTSMYMNQHILTKKFLIISSK